MAFPETVASRSATTYPEASSIDAPAGPATALVVTPSATTVWTGVPACTEPSSQNPIPAASNAAAPMPINQRRRLRSSGDRAAWVRSMRSWSRRLVLGSIGAGIAAIPPTAAQGLEQRDGIGVSAAQRAHGGDSRLLIAQLGCQQRHGVDRAVVILSLDEIQAFACGSDG